MSRDESTSRTAPGAPSAPARQPEAASPRRLRRLVIVCGAAFALVTLCVCLCLANTRVWSGWPSGLQFRSASHDTSGGDDSGYGDLEYLGYGKAALGEFRIRLFNPVTDTSTQLNFRLEGHTVCDDEEALREFMKHNGRRFREEVTVAIRNCEPEDMDDLDLELLERKVVSRVNRVLGRKFLRALEIKDLDLARSSRDDAPPEYDIEDFTSAR